jgi:precorrin-2/cobalt-factor-2 C20-methyltransferase
MSGVLYGVGLGPGDPELITLKAARLIETAAVIAYPALPNEASFARAIGAGLIPEGAREIVVDMPITLERGPAQAGYDAGAQKIAAELEAGRDVVMLCEGDPFFYGSFMYLHARLASRFRVEIVPGVASAMASAARAGVPLVARNEVLTVLPAPLSGEVLKARIAATDSAVVMKLGRHLGKVRRVIGRLGLMDRAWYVERATLAEERVVPLAEAPEEAPYFSMIIVTKGADPWL